MKIVIAQINTTIGDFEGNTQKIVSIYKRACQEMPSLIVFPELTVCGYPPRDLLHDQSFLEKNLHAINEISHHIHEIPMIVGYARYCKDNKNIYNSAAILHHGDIVHVQDKILLPEYDVFDEQRYFSSANEQSIYSIQDKKIGITICEDIWSNACVDNRISYTYDPVRSLKEKGADIIINLSASPFVIGKHDLRLHELQRAALSHQLPIVYCNLVGGNDELVFDGRSMVFSDSGDVIYEAALCQEEVAIIDLNTCQAENHHDYDNDYMILQCLALGLSDYMKKCGFCRAIIGLSGGIDSALVAAIAVKSLGADNVLGILMPSCFSSQDSIDDAISLAKNLNINYRIHEINSIYNQYRSTLCFDHAKDNVTLAEENIQARIRGNILMAISNSENAMVLSTGNKSELSVGYCTLYGDMAGGLSVLSDVPKNMVYRLANYLNRDNECIPMNTIQKPPSAELRPGQLDADSLPDYEQLDAIIQAYIEDGQSSQGIANAGYDLALVKKVIHMVDRNEYKRRQAAPGLKITSKAYGMGRRIPLARKLEF